MKKIVIIGAGIHGLTTGIELAKSGYDITILDKNPGILGGTSGATHNRAHLGYHYPRSIETAKECKIGLENFKAKYPESIVDIDSYYMIEKTGNVSLEEYKKFCKVVDIPFNLQWPDEEILIRDSIEGGTLTKEPIFDINKLKTILLDKVKELGINLILSTELITFEKGKTLYNIFYKKENVILNSNFDIIINATYAYSNNILKILNLEEDFKKYKIQYTEIIVVKSNKELPSITIMDGPFCSIMKYAGKKNQYLLYDVKYSTLYEHESLFVKDKVFITNFAKIKDHFRKYFPFIDDLKYIDSWRGCRPVPLEIIDDARNTNIISHKKYPGIYSILEGKFISATLIADQIKTIITSNHIK